MFTTGARVHEILDLWPCDLQLERPFQLHLFGKGRKEHICPLWTQTAQLFRAFLAEAGSEDDSRERLFRNHRGILLTRFGVRYLLAKYCDQAKPSAPSLSGGNVSITTCADARQHDTEMAKLSPEKWSLARANQLSGVPKKHGMNRYFPSE